MDWKRALRLTSLCKRWLFFGELYKRVSEDCELYCPVRALSLIRFIEARGRRAPLMLHRRRQHGGCGKHPRRVDVMEGVDDAVFQAIADDVLVEHQRVAAPSLAFELLEAGAPLSVVADSLEELGVIDVELLAHLRSPGEHFSSC